MSQQISLVMASSSLRADDLVKTLGNGDLSEAEAGKKGFLRKEDSGVWIFLDKGLIEDETIARIEKVVDMWRDGRIPQRVPWKDLTVEEKRIFGGVLAHGFSGRIPGMLEGRLASSNRWFAYRVDAEIGRGGKDTVTLSLEMTQDQPSVRPPSTAPKGEPELEGAREVALRMTRGFPRSIEPETVARAFKMLDELRGARLEKVRARVDAEGWRRLQEKMANPKSWDGKSPIRFGDLDPGIQERLIQSLNGGKISPDEMVGPIRFNFYIGLGEGKGSSVNGIFGAYR